jgi:hypothetical protein
MMNHRLDLSIITLFLISLLRPNDSFAPKSNLRNYKLSTVQHALTPRQIQFWSEVKTGLRPIETFYRTDKNQSMERIWDFVERAESGKSAVGVVGGHCPSEEHVEGLTAKVIL